MCRLEIDRERDMRVRTRGLWREGGREEILISDMIDSKLR